MADRKAERKQECVQVVIRCRPFSTKESNEGRGNVISMETALFQVSLRNPAKSEQAPKHFTFDAVYDEDILQRTFYEDSCYDLVEGVMEGYNGTIFAYGQTGCGKTHTMQGYSDPPELRGVIPHSFDHIFENITGSVSTTYLVRCSYLEIYNEEVRDLLAVDGEKNDKLEIKEDSNKGVYIKGLTHAIVSNEEGINRLMERGQRMRTVGATAMNATSSRSHSIFTIVVEMNDVDDAGKDHIRVGKLNLVDLAGSERASKTGATGDRLKEGCKINLSLSALGNVISALVDGKGKHIPYRDSKLTRLLQDSLGGNTKTLMVAAISPADYNYEETLSTLRYANRAKNIKNKPKINEDPKDAMLRQYKEEIEKLKDQLAEAHLGASITHVTGDNDGMPDVDAENEIADTALTVQEPDMATADAGINATSGAGIEGEGIEGVEGSGCVGSAVADAGDKRSIAPEDSRGVIDDSECISKQGEFTLSDGGKAVTAGEDSAVSGGGEGDIEGGVGEVGHDRDVAAMRGPTKAGGDAVPATTAGASPEVLVQEKIIEQVVVQEVEVESQKMADQRQALENYSRAMEEQRNRLGQELETSVIRADAERQAREEMARKLEALQTKVIGLSSAGTDRRPLAKAVPGLGDGAVMSRGAERGGQDGEAAPGLDTMPHTEDPEVIIARRNAEHRRIQAKLRQKRRKETRLELERVRALEEKAEVEKEMADVVGQAEEKQRRLNKSRKRLERKLVEARDEIDDLGVEHEREREELLYSIRTQSKELQLWEQVTKQILSSKEIARIWERGEYDEDEQMWVLPRIKPRASYAGEQLKLPLLPTPRAVVSSAGGIGEDVGGLADGGGGAIGGKKDRRRAGGGGHRSEVRRSVSGGGMDGGSGSSPPCGRVTAMNRAGNTDGECDGDGGSGSGDGRKRRSSTAGRKNGAGEDRLPRRSEGEFAPKEGGGGGVFSNDSDSRWEVPANRGSAEMPRGKVGENLAVLPSGLWEDVGPPSEGNYKGLTPPISPTYGRLSSPAQGGTPGDRQQEHRLHSRGQRRRGSVEEVSGAVRRPSSRRDSVSSSAAGMWDVAQDDVAEIASRSWTENGCEGDLFAASFSGGGDGSKSDRCPSRQGGSRTGIRGVARGKPARDQRHQQQQQQQHAQQGSESRHTKDGPEDSLLFPDSFGGGDGSRSSKGLSSHDPANGGLADVGFRPEKERIRAKSRRKKTRASMGGMKGGAGDQTKEPNGMMTVAGTDDVALQALVT